MAAAKGCMNLAHAQLFCRSNSLVIKQPHLLGGKPVTCSLFETNPCQGNFHRKILKMNFITFKTLESCFVRGGFEIFPDSLVSFETSTKQRINNELLGQIHCVESREYISKRIRIFYSSQMVQNNKYSCTIFYRYSTQTSTTFSILSTSIFTSFSVSRI